MTPEYEWERLVRSAKSAFSQHAYLKSIQLNEIALDKAQSQFSYMFRTGNAEKGIACVLICYLNIIDSNIALSNYRKTVFIFEDSLQFLREAKHLAALSFEQQTAILNGSRQLYRESILFTQSYSEHLEYQEQKRLQKITSGISVLCSDSIISH